MEYQKIANLLNDESNQPYIFRTRNWVEINDESKGTYTSNDIKFKTTMLKSNLCDYEDAYILVKKTINITGNAGAELNPNVPRTAAQILAARQADERDNGVIFKNCASFTKCISRINNTDIDIIMPMHNLIEHSDNYAKISGTLWQYYKDDPNDNITTMNHLNLR